MSDPNDSHHYYSPQRQHLSPAARTQAVARGRAELMEIVRNMPESTYELSLKDIVDKPQPPHPPPQAEQEEVEEEEEGRRGDCPVESKASMQKKGSRRKGNGSTGFLLKMVFPIGFGAKRNQKQKKKQKTKKNCGGNSTNKWAKVSPKPPAAEGSVKAAEREWWKKPSNGSEDAQSSGSSRGSTRRVSGLLPRFWAFFRRARGNKGAAVQGRPWGGI